MCWIRVNDIFEELSEENKRLLNELLFANKCLNVLMRFKTFIDFNCNKLKTNLDSNDLQKFEILCKEVEELLEEKQNIINDNIKEKQTSITKSLPIEAKKKPIISSKKVPKITSKRRAISQLKKKRKFSSVRKEYEFEDNLFEPNIYSNDITEEEQPISQEFKQEISETEEPFDLKKRVICEYVGCGKHYSSRDNMREHYRKHFLENRLRCEVEGCNYKTWRKSNLINHMNVHKGLKPHECSYCGKGFIAIKFLNSHIKYMHTVSDETIVCEICDKSFKNKHSFYAHNKSVHIYEKRFVCDHPNCDFRAICESYIKNHKHLKHSKERPFVCTFEGCSKTYKRKTDLKSHMVYHRPERNVKCPHEGCGKAFKHKDILRQHIFTHSEIKLGCDWPGCDFETSHPSALKGHRAVHISDREFVCDWPQCAKTFTRKQQLKIHLRIHNCDKRFTCHWPGCQYRCVESSNLKKHMRVHQK